MAQLGARFHGMEEVKGSNPFRSTKTRPNKHRVTKAFPYSSKVNGSRHTAMRELRVQHQGQPYRVLYIFDPRRVALLLLGGDKTGDDRWYEKNVPLADQIYDNYLAEMEEENNAKDDKVQ